MPGVKLLVDASIYGRVDKTILLSSSRKEQNFKLTEDNIYNFISMIEWFEPSSQELDKLISVLFEKRTPIYQILVDIANGEYGKDYRLKQGADFFGRHYINSADINNFFLTLEPTVRRHGVQKTISIDKLGKPITERLKFSLDVIIEKGGK